MEEDQALDNVKAELPKQDSVATAVADGYICETCSKVFVNKAKLQTHRRQVHSEKRFACPHCDKVFKSKDGIKKHMPVHTGEKNYVCKHCGKAFGDPSSRNQHEKFQHPSEGNKIICKECGKQFKYAGSLRKHMAFHKQGSTYDGKKIQYSNEIKAEALKMATELSATETALKLNIHVSAVNNWIDSFKKGHQCSKCAKNFGSRQRLTDHERTHHSEQSVRPLGEGFSGRFTSEWKQEVVDFAAQNGRDKTCEVYALSESTLRGFIKMMHNPMYCHICSGKYRNQSQLDRHLYQVHKIEKPYCPKLSLNQYLEDVNVDINKLSESFTDRESRTREEVDPQNIVPYDPSDGRRIPREIKPKVKRQRVKKEKSLKGSTATEDGFMKEEFESEKAVEADFVIKEDSAVKEEVKVEIEVKEEVNDSFECSDMEIMDFNDNNEHSDDEQDNIQGELENLESGDFDTLVTLLNTQKKTEMETEGPEQIKAERSSLDEKSLNNNDKDLSPKDDNESKDIEIGKDNAKQEEIGIGLKSEILMDEYENTRPVKMKKLKEGREKYGNRRNKYFQSKAEHLIDFSLDLTKYDINGEDEEFCILSKHFKDENFIDVVFSQKYKHKKKIFKCSECLKVFKAACDIVRHLPQHSSEKNYLCEFCNMAFTHKSNLTRHRENKHSQAEGPKEKFRCQYCGKEYKDKSSLKTHEELKHEEKRYQCDTCGMDFAYKQYLKRHIAVDHEGQNPIKHTCTICGKGFINTNNYRAHYDAHINGNQHTCDLCGKSFQQASYLKSHKMGWCKNSDVPRPEPKKHKCQHCEKEYTDKRALTDHVKIIHEGVTDTFACDVCNQKFSRRTSLYAHALLHKGEYKVYTCDNCGTRYKDKSHLEQHQMSCHKSECP